MRIQVLHLEAGNPVAVECETPAGRLLVAWGGSEPPLVGESYDVEIDPVGELAWGDQVAVDRSQETTGASFVGLVEHIEGDTVMLRVSESVVVLEVAGDPPLGILGREVSVNPEALVVYPTGV
ncbi:hypothetical protein [Intrasporangium mesophilum]